MQIHGYLFLSLVYFQLIADRGYFQGAALRQLVGPAELLTPLLNGLDAVELMALAPPDAGESLSRVVALLPCHSKSNMLIHPARGRIPFGVRGRGRSRRQRDRCTA